MMLLQSVVLLLAVSYLVWHFRETLGGIYFGPLSTDIGLVVNGLIAALLLIALLRQLYLLVAYIREEQALKLFEEQIDFGISDAGIEPIESSLVVQRYRRLWQAGKDQEPVQQATLATLLRGQEVARLGLVRLVLGLLILLGVFGTVLSLSLALLGASDLFLSPQSTAGLSTVVRGMATALSTTMTAIAAYLVLAFVFSRLGASQTHVCQRIESLTLNRLLSMTRSEGSLQLEIGRLTREFHSLAGEMGGLRQALEQVQERVGEEGRLPEAMLQELERIARALKEGFRLDQRTP